MTTAATELAGAECEVPEPVNFEALGDPEEHCKILVVPGLDRE